MSAISIKQLLEAGVHFGHQTHRWNPRMKDYIFGERNGIYIIDLQKTLRLFKDAVDFVSAVAAQGKAVLFVGTKRQAQEAVEEEATRCGMFYVNNRWLGGLLTNFVTIRNSIKRYKELDSMRDDGFYSKLSKKEAARLERERKKLEKNLRGIRDMDELPGAVFVIDSGAEAIAVKEANKLSIPVVAVVDTNSDPDTVDYVIPGNDDALRAVRLFASTIADAVRAGRSVYEAKLEAERQEAQERAREEAARKAAEKDRKEAMLKAARERAARAEAAAAAEAAAEEALAKAAAEETVSPAAPAAEVEEEKKAEAEATVALETSAVTAVEEEEGAEADLEEALEDELVAEFDEEEEEIPKPRKAAKPPKSTPRKGKAGARKRSGSRGRAEEDAVEAET